MNTPIRLEAESFQRVSYRLESSSLASGGSLLSFVGGATNESGSASRLFSAPSGSYDVVLGYFDENDGVATFQLRIGGSNVATLTLDQNLGNGGISSRTIVRRPVATRLSIGTNSLIEILGMENGAEHARVDYVEFIPIATTIASTPGSLAFSASSFRVNENGAPVAAVTIARTGGSTGTVGTTLTLTNGTAIAPADYNNTPIAVTFAPGETTKTIAIPLVDDLIVEGNETLNLRLTNPSGGATLGSQSTAVLTIADNDGAIRIEAESLTRSGGYRVESSSVASGGAFIGFRSGSTTLNETGSASGRFTGASGTYDVVVGYFDENDGAATLQLQVGNTAFPAWTLNQSLGSNSISSRNLVRRVVASGITINQNDTLQITGIENAEEHARVDYIELIPAAAAAGVMVTPSNGNTIATEGGDSDSYTIALTSQPIADVTIAIAPNPQLSVDKMLLTFTPTTWNVPQTVLVSAIDDALREGNHTATLLHSISSADPSYAGAIVANLPVAINDNDLAVEQSLGQLGTFSEWQKIEIPLVGPQTSATATPNPFQTSVMVTFQGPGGTFTIPAFYDGDGQGGSSGNVWKVRFSANAIGNWTFSTSSSEPLLNGYSGSFTVIEPGNTAPDLRRWGRLQYAGEHYLKFADGHFWLKGGSDEPENLLGRAFGSWEQKKAAIDFLQAQGVNSLYIMLNTLEGDGQDVWAWLGNTQVEAKANSTRFDVAKLQQWDDLFNYAIDRGMVLHLVMDDDSAWVGYDHTLFYREMVARFGYLPSIVWNIGEEANEAYSNTQQIQFANLLRSLDPYDSPVTVHRQPVGAGSWNFVGNPNFDLTSIQVEPGGAVDFSTVVMPSINQLIINNRNSSAAAGRPIPVMVDETPRVDQVTEATLLKMRSQVLYPLYLGGGGGYEILYEFQDAVSRPNGLLTVQAMEPMWDTMTHSRRFVEGLPFYDMAPNNALLSTTTANFVLAQPGVAYGIYLTNGLTPGEAVSLDLRNITGTFQVRWYDVRTGIYQDGAILTGGDWRSLENPAFAGDVAVSVVNTAFKPADLLGTAFADTLSGISSAETIAGRFGNDTITGRGGADQFFFRTPLDGTDTITDFNSDDRLTFSAYGFGNGLVPGTSLSAIASPTGTFVSDSNPTPLSNNATFLYNTTTGLLSFDPDGTGARTANPIAFLQNTPTVTIDQLALVP